MANNQLVKSSSTKQSSRRAVAPWDRCCDTQSVALAVAQSEGDATPESILHWIEARLAEPEGRRPVCVTNAFGDQLIKACEESIQVCLDYLVEEKVLHLTPAGVYRIESRHARQLAPALAV